MGVRLIFDAQFCGREEIEIHMPDHATEEDIKKQFYSTFGISYDENCSYEIIGRTPVMNTVLGGSQVNQVKVIFLDVDGVLNSNKTTRRTASGWIFVGSRQLKNLKHIINETGAKVVLSSDWRYDRDDPECNSDYLELRDELLRYGIQFYGFTPELPSVHRGAEIAHWLAEHPEVSNFVVLDDRSDIEPNKDHWVRTVMSRGLDVEETEEAIRILKRE